MGRVNDTVVILPTYNEAGNLRELLPELQQHEVDILVVDDSPNTATKYVAEGLGVSVLTRNGKRGRVSAMLDGIAITTHRNIITMDADLQHPPEIVPRIAKALERSDIVIASRCVKGGSYGDFPLGRKVVSVVANLLALPLAPKVKDRDSGFIAFRREVLDGVQLGTQGFKFGLRILVKGKYSTLEEIPYTFLPRERGQSKLSAKIMAAYLVQLFHLYLYKFRILRFMLVGASGTLLGLGSLYALTEFAGLYYLLSYVIAFVLSVTNNYIWNSLWTFRRKKGMRGWIKYAAIYVLTLALNTTLMYVLTDTIGVWYMLSAVLVVLLVFLLNYTLSRRLVWHK